MRAELDKKLAALAKNGGGAHLDLMTAAYSLAAWRARPSR